MNKLDRNSDNNTGAVREESTWNKAERSVSPGYRMGTPKIVIAALNVEIGEE